MINSNDLQAYLNKQYDGQGALYVLEYLGDNLDLLDLIWSKTETVCAGLNLNWSDHTELVGAVTGRLAENMAEKAWRPERVKDDLASLADLELKFQKEGRS